MALGSPFWGSRGSHLIVLVQQPVLLWVIQWVDHLRHKLVLLSDLKHGSCILVTTTVICG